MFERACHITGTLCYWLLWAGLVGGVLFACLGASTGWGGLLAFVLVMPFAALIGGVVFAPLSFAVGVLAGGIASAAAAFSRFARS